MTRKTTLLSVSAMFVAPTGYSRRQHGFCAKRIGNPEGWDSPATGSCIGGTA